MSSNRNTLRQVFFDQDASPNGNLKQCQKKGDSDFASPKRVKLNEFDSPREGTTPGAAAHFTTPTKKRVCHEEGDQDIDGLRTPKRIEESEYYRHKHESFFKRPTKNGSGCMGSSEKRNYWEIIENEQINFRLDFTEAEREGLRLFATQ